MSDVKEIAGKVFDAMAEFKDVMASEDQDKVYEHLTQIGDIVAAIKDIFSDGLQLSDATKVGQIVGPVMKLASSFKDYEGLGKKRFVSEVVWLVYRTIDTWPDGNHNNINIPFVFGAIERKVERCFVVFAAGMAIDALYDRMKEGVRYEVRDCQRIFVSSRASFFR